MTFSKWLEEADMPTLQNGEWVDLETGIPYIPYTMAPAPRAVLSDKAQDARYTAKAFSGKALKGTTKQKEWAEKIRAGKLNQMDVDLAHLACTCNLLAHSKFWIEHRDKPAAAIGEFVQQQRALLKQARTLKTRGAAAEYAAVAAQYNELTKQWGWND